MRRAVPVIVTTAGASALPMPNAIREQLNIDAWEPTLNEYLPQMLAGHRTLKVRDVTHWYRNEITDLAYVPASFPPSSTSSSDKEPCVQLDHLAVSNLPNEIFGVNQTSPPQFVVPESTCEFNVLWLPGVGYRLDRLVQNHTAYFCAHYNHILTEDELYTAKISSTYGYENQGCTEFQFVPFCSRHTKPAEMIPQPFTPGAPIPVIEKPYVSFHAYLAYEADADSVPPRWLVEPDSWMSYLADLRNNGFLKVCMERSECVGDDAPYRLMFWEHVSQEYVDCLASGITPVFFASAAIESYEARETTLTPFRFHTPEDMHHQVSYLSSPKGVLHNGTKASMVQEANQNS